MTRTLGGKALNVKGFKQELSIVAAEADTWGASGYARDVNVVGGYRRFDLDCWESAKSWPNSDVKFFEEHADAGDTMTFTFADGYIHSLSCAVKILSVGFEIDVASRTSDPIRRFHLTLQEV